MRESGADIRILKILHVADSFYNMYEAHRYLLKSTRLEAEDLKEYKSQRELFRAAVPSRLSALPDPAGHFRG